MTLYRLYLKNSGGAPAVSPPFHGSWTETSEGTRWTMVPSIGVGADTGGDFSSEGVAGHRSVLIRQYQCTIAAAGLPAGNMPAGTFRAIVVATQSLASVDAWLQVRVRIYDPISATYRGTIYNGQAVTTVSANPADNNYEFPTTPTTETRCLQVATSPVAGVLSTDLLVVELGYDDNNANATSRACTLFMYAQPSAGPTDYAFTVGQAHDGTNKRPWVELDLVYLSAPATPTGLTVTPSADGTELELDWASGGGDPEDGYDVRINGGSPTDVGNVLTHDFTGLTPGTSYTLEVRAYNAAGDSAYASIGGTTTGPPDPPTGLSVTPNGLGTELDLDWVAPVAGDPLDGYEVRDNGGTPVDVGNVLTHTFDVLPATTHVLEVRAYNAAGFSAWVDVEETAPTPTVSIYTATIAIGEDHLFEIDSGDCSTTTGPVVVLDGLKIGWTVPESNPWPTQPDPVNCQIGLWAANPLELDDVVLGTPVSVVLTDVLDNVFASFHGRVSAMTARPRHTSDPDTLDPVLALLYQLSCVDYTVDLAELPCTIDTEWPAEDADARIDRINSLIVDRIGPNVGVEPLEAGGATMFEAYPAGTTNALDLLDAHVSQIAADVGEGLQRHLIVPIVQGAAPGQIVGYELVLLDRVIDGDLLPGVLDVVGGELVLTFPDLDAQGVVDACAVDLDVAWNRLKFRAPNIVTVAGETVTATASRSGPPVRLTLGTTLTELPAAQAMANLYLPDVDEANGWVADTFRFHAYRRPASLVPAWLPDHTVNPGETTLYVRPIAIVGIPDTINLAGDLEVYAGQLVKVELTVSQSRVYVDFSLRRQLPTASGGGTVTWQDVLDTWPTLTWDDVDPGLSWYEARMGRMP